MGQVPGVGGPKEPEKPSVPVEGPPSELKPGENDKVPNKWSAAIKKFPALLDAVLKGLAMKIMKDSKKHAQKRQKNK